MSLFSYETHVDARRVRARTLVVTVNGFNDVGHTQGALNRALTDHLTGHVIGHVAVDQVLDYRDQRPAMVFDRDHFEDYRTPEIALHSLVDESGEPFLLLRGPEPAFRWEELAREIETVVQAHEVQLVVFASSIPMAAPHTRPIVTTRWASDPALIPGNQPRFGTMMLPSSFPTMLAYRLGEHGHAVVGLAAHVPHYLADMDYPDGALALVRAISEVSGLHLPTQTIALAAGVVRAQIGAQIAASEELTEMVTTLETQYDEATHQHELTAEPEEVPSADEIGAEVENFLKGLGEDPGSPSEGEDGVPDPA